MTNRCLVVACGWAILTVASTAHAQDGSAQARSHAQPEITAYVFLGLDASGGVGAAVRWPLPGHLSVELESSVRRAQVAPFSTNVSLLFDFPKVGPVTPYVAGGIGLDQYAFADQSPAGTVVASAGTALSVNAGGGVRIRVDENWGIRTDARWINDVGRRAPERFRLYNGVTFGGKGR
jgi:hypothetical protein